METSKETSSNLIRKYQRYLKLEKGYSPNTLDAYIRDVDKLLKFLSDEEKTPQEAKLEDIENFAAAVCDLGIGARSLARILSGVRQFYRFLVLDGYMEADPTELLESPKQPQHLPEVLSTAEVDMLERAIDLLKWEGQRTRAIIEVLFSCGLRVSELCHLTFPDLFLDEGYLRVQGKGSKQRLVPLSDSAIAEVTRYLRDPDRATPKRGQEDYVFLSRRGQAISRITVFVMVREAAEMAGVDKKISPHTFRHSFATALLEGGANLQAIQLLLGHEDVATTEIYTHIDRGKLREQIERYHPRNQRRPEDSNPK